MSTAAIYDCVVGHARGTPVRHQFRYRTYQWLVDLDELPRLPWPLRPLARFQARDHLGDPRAGIRENVEAYLARHGVDVTGGQILLLTNARVFGYVFNPLSLFWCHRADGSLACVLAEVHNTYGERHCYLLRPDAQGRAEVDKAFYVSPYFPVDGHYAMTLPEPGAQLRLVVTLHREGAPPFTAYVRGQRLPTDARTIVSWAVRHPWAPALVSVRIRWQGLLLYARGLRPVPRPRHLPEEGVQ